MKTTSAVVYAFAILLTAAALAADQPYDIGKLPPAVQRAINEQKGAGEVQNVKTRRVDGRVEYEVEYKERGENKHLLVGEDGSVISEKQPPGKGKGKAKGKGKGNRGRGENENRNEDENRPQSQPSVAEPAKPQSATTTPAPTAPSATAPAPSATTPAPSAAKPPPSVTTPAPSARGAAPGTGVAPTATPAPKRTPAEVKADVNRRVDRINQLDNDRRVRDVGLAAISQETGVPVATLQAQRKEREASTAALLVANEMARVTGKPATALIKQRQQLHDWERVAAENKFDLATVVPKLERVQQAMEAARKPPAR